MLKDLITYTFCLLFLFSCKKSNTENIPVVNQDSLGHGWSKVFIGEGNTMVDIQFSDNTGFSVGGNKIFKSIDGGDTWVVVRSTSSPVTNLSMWGEDNIIVAGGSNQIYSSLDGGSSFQQISLDDNALNEVAFVGDKTAYAIGNHLWKTSDGGVNWQKLYSFPEISTQIYRSIHFINENRGWAIASNASSEAGLYKTEDGGINWTVLDSGYAKYGIATMSILYDNVAFLNNLREFSQSGDGGKTWNKIITNTISAFNDTHFLNPDYGYISDSKHIYKIIDMGSSISTEVSLSPNNNNANIVEIYFTNIYRGWACGYKGYILKYER